MTKTTWFTGDTHFAHANVIKHSARPFDTIEAMNAALIRNWNLNVQDGDDVFHLGDFAWRDALPFRDQLKGNIHLIIGNHEDAAWKIKQRFMWVKDVHMIRVVVDGVRQDIWLSHYSHEVWPRSHHGTWHLYGHSHNSLKARITHRSMDVGVDAVAARLSGIEQGSGHQHRGPTLAIDYRPISFAEVAAVMATRRWEPIDHHGAPSEI